MSKISIVGAVGGTAAAVSKTAKKTQVRLRPIIKADFLPSVRTKSASLSIIKPIEKKITKPAIQASLKSKSLTKQLKISKQATQPKTTTKTQTKTLMQKLTKPILVQAETATTTQTAKEETITLPKLTQAEVPITTQIQRTRTALFIKPTIPPVISPTLPTKKLTLPKRKSIKLPALVSKKESGYHVYAKEKGRFVKVSKKPLPKQDALRLGATVVDETVSATFKIKKARKKVEKPLISFRPFNLFKFRQKKGTKNVFVEKNTFRIDSLGELKGITVKGWLARKKKKLGAWF